MNPNKCIHEFIHESDVGLHPSGSFMMPATRRCKKCNIILGVTDTEMIRSVRSYESLTRISIYVAGGAFILSAIAFVRSFM